MGLIRIIRGYLRGNTRAGSGPSCRKWAVGTDTIYNHLMAAGKLLRYS
jgi:hypothetical protein